MSQLVSLMRRLSHFGRFFWSSLWLLQCCLTGFAKIHRLRCCKFAVLCDLQMDWNLPDSIALIAYATAPAINTQSRPKDSGKLEWFDTPVGSLGWSEAISCSPLSCVPHVVAVGAFNRYHVIDLTKLDQRAASIRQSMRSVTNKLQVWIFRPLARLLEPPVPSKSSKNKKEL